MFDVTNFVLISFAALCYFFSSIVASFALKASSALDRAINPIAMGSRKRKILWLYFSALNGRRTKRRPGFSIIKLSFIFNSVPLTVILLQNGFYKLFNAAASIADPVTILSITFLIVISFYCFVFASTIIWDTISKYISQIISRKMLSRRSFRLIFLDISFKFLLIILPIIYISINTFLWPPGGDVAKFNLKLFSSILYNGVEFPLLMGVITGQFGELNVSTSGRLLIAISLSSSFIPIFFLIMCSAIVLSRPLQNVTIRIQETLGRDASKKIEWLGNSVAMVLAVLTALFAAFGTD